MGKRPQRINRQDILRSATIREFDGGWNVIDNDLNLSTRFAKVLDNMSRLQDGSIGVRWGTRLFSNLSSVMQSGETLINVYYYDEHLVAVGSKGYVYKVNTNGVATAIWTPTIAATLVGSPPFWSATTFASFAVFNGELIICNGVDKPLLVNFDRSTPCAYLVDVPSGSNANTPICKYVIAANSYVIMAGDPLHPSRVHISNLNSSGTWYGDAPPNDATFIDLNKIAASSTQIIRGLGRFRDLIAVMFDDVIVLGELGIYDSSTGAHIPAFQDIIDQHGTVSHRSVQSLGNDLFMADSIGVPSIARALFTGSIRPERVSQLIEPEIQAIMGSLSIATAENKVFSVYNSREGQYMLFIPNHEEVAQNLPDDPISCSLGSTDIVVYKPVHRLDVDNQVTFAGLTSVGGFTTAALNTTHVVKSVINEDYFIVEMPTAATADVVGGGTSGTITPKYTETLCFVYTYIPGLKIKAWSRYRGWKFSCGCRSVLGRIFFGEGQKLYVLGNDDDRLTMDFIDDAAVNSGEGKGIAFVWELPWADFDRRFDKKHSRYIALDTKGEASFTMQMYVDNFYKDKRTGELLPELSMAFVGGDSGGYGAGPQPYGGGRRTSDERLWAWPARFKIAKLRVEGTATKRLRIVAITLSYLNGSIRR